MSRTRKPATISPQDIARFNEKIRQSPNGCWIWIGARSSQTRRGHAVKTCGSFYINGRKLGARRVAFEIAHGQLRSREVVRSICGDTACVNPTHLVVGTLRASARDVYRRRRHPLATLSAEQVRDIHRLRQEGCRPKQLAERFQVHVSTIYDVLSRRRYQYVDIDTGGTPGLMERTEAPVPPA